MPVTEVISQSFLIRSACEADGRTVISFEFSYFLFSFPVRIHLSFPAEKRKEIQLSPYLFQSD